MTQPSRELAVGMRVKYAYNTAAVSCQRNGGKVRGEGTIDEIRPPGREPYIGVGHVWLFPREITDVLSTRTEASA